jgi:hypothetical protein
MEWSSVHHRELSEIVESKYEEFGDLRVWVSYLESLGIVRDRGNWIRRGDGIERIVLECPWSLRNSIPGNVLSKFHLGIPRDMAEKIIILGIMP